MAAEIEVKLEAPVGSATQFLQLPWLKRIASAPIRRQHLVSVYYDTSKRVLWRKGVSLRVRRDGYRRVQTVKADPKGATGPFARDEWETEIEGTKPDLTLAKTTALAQFKLKKLWHGLRPIFETDIRRATIPVRIGGSAIEIAIDQGRVKTQRKQEGISEIELELKQGDPVRLVSLAKRIAREIDASFGFKAKAERGYGLQAGARDEAVYAEEIILDSGMTAGDAFQVIGLSCLRHFAGNCDAVGRGAPEGVHQMRVGLRRLRAAMSFFKSLLADAESAGVKKELKWLLGEMGPARDLDVLISESVEPLQQARVDGDALATLKTDLVRRRQDGLARARAATASPRYRRLVLRTALWIVGGRWSAATDPLHKERRDRAASDFAADELARRHRKILKGLKKLKELDPRRRHKLRIAIKKLRYADEFFASLHRHGGAKRRLKRHGVALKHLQSALGKLNDLQVHDKMANAFIRSKQPSRKKLQKSFALGLISGKDHERVFSLLDSANAARRELKDGRPYWE